MGRGGKAGLIAAGWLAGALPVLADDLPEKLAEKLVPCLACHGVEGQSALENVPSKVVVDIAADNLAIYADAMLPATPVIEKDGHYTDWEGRTQRFRPVRAPLGLARSEWEIFQELSEVIGAGMGFHSLDDLHQEMAKLLGPLPAAEVAFFSAACAESSSLASFSRARFSLTNMTEEPRATVSSSRATAASRLATARLRRHQRQILSGTPAGRARIGSPVSQRSKSFARAAASA